MEKSAKRTVQAIKTNIKLEFLEIMMLMESILLYLQIFSKINISNEIYIPDRKTEGYGPSIKSIKKLIDNGVKLIFTVDWYTIRAIEFAFKNKSML